MLVSEESRTNEEEVFRAVIDEHTVWGLLWQWLWPDDKRPRGQTLGVCARSGVGWATPKPQNVGHVVGKGTHCCVDGTSVPQGVRAQACAWLAGKRWPWGARPRGCAYRGCRGLGWELCSLESCERL